MSDLDGATECGEPNTYPSDPGQFAARWNSWTEERRTEWLHSSIRNSQAWERCYVMHRDQP